MNIIIGYKEKQSAKSSLSWAPCCTWQLDQALVSYLPFGMTELSSSKLIIFGAAHHPSALRAECSLCFETRAFISNWTRQQVHTHLPGYPSWYPGTHLHIWAQCPPSELASNTWPSHCRNSLPSLLWFVPSFLLPWMHFHLISYPVLFSGSRISPLLRTGILFWGHE